MGRAEESALGGHGIADLGEDGWWMVDEHGWMSAWGEVWEEHLIVDSAGTVVVQLCSCAPCTQEARYIKYLHEDVAQHIGLPANEQRVDLFHQISETCSSY
jgi:hypothetical protein